MERRVAIKRMTGLAALAFLPKQHLYALQQKKPIHIIGLGSTGTAVLKLIHSRGLNYKYTAITDSIDSNFPADVKLITYRPYLSKMDRLMQEIYHPEDVVPFKLPTNVSTLLKEDHRYVLIGGLGGYTGTHMARDIIHQLKGQRKDFRAVFSLPFHFEGRKTRGFANDIQAKCGDLAEIRYFDSEVLRKKYGNMSISSAFDKVKEEMVEIFLHQMWI